VLFQFGIQIHLSGGRPWFFLYFLRITYSESSTSTNLTWRTPFAEYTPSHLHIAMRTFKSLAALALAGSVLGSDVHDLKTDTFKDFVSSNSLALIEFFAPW